MSPLNRHLQKNGCSKKPLPMNEKNLAGKFLRIQRISALIRRKGTGTLLQLASRVGVSDRTILRDLDELRYLGAKIAYDRHQQTYYYVEPFMYRIA